MKSKVDIITSNQNIEYFDALDFMKKKVKKILDNEENEMLWFLNHNHIYTCGTSANKNEILFKTNVPIVKTNRGGKTTYHGPGQLVGYPICDLNALSLRLHGYMRFLTEHKKTIVTMDNLHPLPKIFLKKPKTTKRLIIKHFLPLLYFS